MVVVNYLDSLNIHPITVTEAVTDENCEKSYQLIKDNPKISKAEFLKKMGIEEHKD